MPSLGRAAALLALVPALSALVLACGSDAPPAGADTTSPDGSTPSFGDGGIPDAGGGALGCSSDLRSLTDRDGKVVATCPPDQGCRAGACVPACEAAAASRGNVGCDFYAPTPAAYPAVLPPCFAAFLANTWPKPAKVAVSRDGQSLDVTQFARIAEDGKPPAQWKPVPAEGIPENQVAVLFLSSDPAAVMTENGVPLTCPVTPAINAATVQAGTGKGKAFHLTSSVPISAYDIMPYGGARSHFPSAELLFPSTAWSDNYVMIATPAGTHTTPGPLWAQVLASQPGTNVRILPVADLPAGGGLPATARATTGSFVLQAGEYAQWEISGSTDLSGSIVLADKPVAVFTGNRFYRQQPSPAPGGDSTHQQNLGLSALGSEYVAAPFATRRSDLAPEAIRYRLVGTVDGTTLTFDPPVTGAPSALARGQVADFVATGPFRTASQDAAHPFAAAQMMDTANLPVASRPGAIAPGYGPWLGDEEFVVMLPPAQFLSRYVFFTDPAYPTTNLVLTRVKSNGAFANVTIDCLGTVGGWRKAGTDDRFEVTEVDLVRAGVGVGTCVNGRHVATSDGPFGIVVWGLDSYSSYAYPGGGNLATLSSVRVEPVPR